MRLKLVYNARNTGKPILSDVILKTQVPINILEAKVGAAANSEMVIDVPVSGRQLEEVISLLRKAEVEVAEQRRIIHVDYDECVSCGACVSPCPVSAITQKPDWSIEIDEKLCVRCGVCVNACPTRAIHLED